MFPHDGVPLSPLGCGLRHTKPVTICRRASCVVRAEHRSEHAPHRTHAHISHISYHHLQQRSFVRICVVVCIYVNERRLLWLAFRRAYIQIYVRTFALCTLHRVPPHRIVAAARKQRIRALLRRRGARDHRPSNLHVSASVEYVYLRRSAPP